VEQRIEPGRDGPSVAQDCSKGAWLPARACRQPRTCANLRRARANINALGPDAAGLRLAFITPGHQYPLGTTIAIGRRFALVSWAKRSGAWIFEDDCDGEYRYAGRPIARFKA
jgi:DNA-binding transcriptional MocR family regulator